MTDTTTQLTREQRETYEREGYLVLPGVFEEEQLTALRAETDRILELQINASLFAGRQAPRLEGALREDGAFAVRKVQPVQDLSPLVAALAHHPGLIGPMRELMGDEPVLMEEKLNPKQVVDLGGCDVGFLRERSLADDHFPLHHDWGYYRQQGYPENTVSSAIALDDCAGRGPIRVIPGSHLVDVVLANPDPASGDGVVADGAVDPAAVVPVDAPAGAVVLFHAKLVHDSEPNLSGLPRRLMIYSHYPLSHDVAGADADRRNGPWRQRAQVFEQAYLDAVAAGECTGGVSV